MTTTDLSEFEGVKVSLCQTPEDLVKSDLFTKALAKNLDVSAAQYVQAIVAKRLTKTDLSQEDIAFLNGLSKNSVAMAEFNRIIALVDYQVTQSIKGADMAAEYVAKPDLPHFDAKGKPDAQKVITWLKGEPESPYAQHAGAASLYEKYGSTHPQFFAKLTIENNGNIVYDHKRFFVNSNGGYELSAQHNGKDILSGEHEDINGKTGIAGVTYMTGKTGGKIAKQQGKKLFKNDDQADAFVDSFPGETTKDKIFALRTLFNLPLGGYWIPNSSEWGLVGSVGDVALSEVARNGYVRAAKWNDSDAKLRWYDQRYPQPVLAFEDC